MADMKSPMLCGHCGKQAAFTVQAEWKKDDVAIIDSPYNEGQEIITWRIFVCSGCKSPTLAETKDLYEFVDHEIYAGVELVTSETTILYPGAKVIKHLTDIPTVIAKEYEATLRVRDISSNACAVLARRTLEAIFTYEGAIGGLLYQKIETLLKSKSIPPLLADVAHLGRHIGNLGAHFEKGEATDEDVTVMLDFLETILEYLYVIPAKVALVKARLKN